MQVSHMMLIKNASKQLIKVKCDYSIHTYLKMSINMSK